MNRFEAMALFVRVAELGSFSAAATQLGVARSVVTRQVAALEQHLGGRLMERSTRRLSLTSVGQAYLEKCRMILELVDEAESGVMAGQRMPSGPLRLSLPLSFGLARLAPLLARFAREYPQIRLAMDFTDQQQDLIGEGIDLSVRITARPEPGAIVRRLGNCRLLTVASPGYLAERGCPQHPDGLAGHECLGYSPRINNRPWIFLVDGQPRAFELPFRLQANNGEALAMAALQGLGITVQPDFLVARWLESGQLQCILDAYAPPELGIYAVLPGNRYMPYRVRVLIEFLAGQLAAGQTPF